MIIITGGAGFIGSALVWAWNERGRKDILVVDNLESAQKWQNLAKRQISHIEGIDPFLANLPNLDGSKVDAVFHMGACSSTDEQDGDYLMRNNVLYSRSLFLWCVKHGVPFYYASSGATYGEGEQGFSDSHDLSPQLRATNKYGYSKVLFDNWVLQQVKFPPHWAGFKFFNVYGPNEYHKGGQASVVFHAYPQVKNEKKLRLFKSYNDQYAHGEQLRDFVYVKDCISVMMHFYDQQKAAKSGIYNVGTGNARTWKDLGTAVFDALKTTPNFEWIDMPEVLRNHYQYYTQAELSRLREEGGYNLPFTPLEKGVADYVCNYLDQKDPYL